MTQYKKHVYSDGSFSFDPVPSGYINNGPWWKGKKWGQYPRGVYGIEMTLEEAEFIHEEAMKNIEARHAERIANLRSKISGYEKQLQNAYLQRDMPALEAIRAKEFEDELGSYQSYKSAKREYFEYLEQHYTGIPNDYSIGEYTLAISSKNNALILKNRLNHLEKEGGPDRRRRIAAEKGRYNEIEKIRQLKNNAGDVSAQNSMIGLLAAVGFIVVIGAAILFLWIA